MVEKGDSETGRQLFEQLSDNLALSVEWWNSSTLFTLKGHLDHDSAPKLIDRVAAYLETTDDMDDGLIFNLGAIESIDSSGLWAVLISHERSQARYVSFSIQDPSEPVREKIERSGLEGHLTVIRSDEEI